MFSLLILRLGVGALEARCCGSLNMLDALLFDIWCSFSLMSYWLKKSDTLSAF